LTIWDVASKSIQRRKFAVNRPFFSVCCFKGNLTHWRRSLDYWADELGLVGRRITVAEGELSAQKLYVRRLSGKNQSAALAERTVLIIENNLKVLRSQKQLIESRIVRDRYAQAKMLVEEQSEERVVVAEPESDGTGSRLAAVEAESVSLLLANEGPSVVEIERQDDNVQSQCDGGASEKPSNDWVAEASAPEPELHENALPVKSVTPWTAVGAFGRILNFNTTKPNRLVRQPKGDCLALESAFAQQSPPKRHEPESINDQLFRIIAELDAEAGRSTCRQR
jgi:hypothetical protein